MMSSPLANGPRRTVRSTMMIREIALLQVRPDKNPHLIAISPEPPPSSKQSMVSSRSKSGAVETCAAATPCSFNGARPHRTRSTSAPQRTMRGDGNSAPPTTIHFPPLRTSNHWQLSDPKHRPAQKMLVSRQDMTRPNLPPVLPYP